MEIHEVSRKRFSGTVVWAVLVSVVLVVSAAFMGRAVINLNAAMTDKPDIAIYLLLPDEKITSIQLLREKEGERDYLVNTAEGHKYVKLKKGAEEWYVAEVEALRK